MKNTYTMNAAPANLSPPTTVLTATRDEMNPNTAPVASLPWGGRSSYAVFSESMAPRVSSAATGIENVEKSTAKISMNFLMIDMFR
jgi:hypothetical protein